MKIKDAEKLAGRSARWLRGRECSWCGQTLLRALQYGCGAIYEPRCDPTKKNFGPDAMERRRADQQATPAATGETK